MLLHGVDSSFNTFRNEFENLTGPLHLHYWNKIYRESLPLDPLEFGQNDYLRF